MENIFILEKSYASFSLPCGKNVYISADAALSPVLETLRAAHKMQDTPLGEHLLHAAYDPAQEKVAAFSPAHSVTYRNEAVSLTAQAARARNIMFLALLPLLQKSQLFLFHGGLALDSNGDGCIFCGPSGVGKSTAVTKCGKIWEILADDLMYLSFSDGRLFARPGPTWSTYLAGKERLVECDINRVVEVKNIIILSRIEEFGIHRMTGQKAKLMLANSFVEMVSWHASMALRDENLTAALRKTAFEGMMMCNEKQRIYRLTSEVDTDITPFLQQIM